MFWIPKPLSVQNHCLFQNQNPVSDCENDQLLCRGATANNIAIAIPKGMKNSHDDGFFSFYIPFGRQHSKKTPLYYLKSRLLASRVTHPMKVQSLLLCFLRFSHLMLLWNCFLDDLIQFYSAVIIMTAILEYSMVAEPPNP